MIAELKHRFASNLVSIVEYLSDVSAHTNLLSSDSRRPKLPSKTAATSHYQNPNIYAPEESSQKVLSELCRTITIGHCKLCCWKQLVVLVFPIQSSQWDIG